MKIHINGIEVAGDASDIGELIGLFKPKKEVAQVEERPKRKYKKRTPNKYKMYSEEDKIYILENIDKMSKSKIGKELGRTTASVNGIHWRMLKGVIPMPEGYEKKEENWLI